MAAQASEYHQWAAGVSQNRLAQRLGTTGASVSRILRGEQENREFVGRISAMAGVDPPPLEGEDPEDTQALHLCRQLRQSDPEAYERLKRNVAAYLESRRALFG